MIRLALAVVALAAALAAEVDETQFRYTRGLSAQSASTERSAPVHFEPDGPMYGHARLDFADLRILDSQGQQVPWRTEPLPAAVASRPVTVVARGRRDGVVTVVLDRGPVPSIVDRVSLVIPDTAFVGSAVVQGSNTAAEGTYARLSTTPIYAVKGAVDARSTTAVFPPSDYRYLLVQARGVSRITGASVARVPGESTLVTVPAKTRRRDQQRATVVRLDLGFANVPVDAVRVRSSTPRYVRDVVVEGSGDGSTFVGVGGGEVARFKGVELSRLDVQARYRYLRVTIRNGDDAPLARLRVTAEARARPLLVAEGYRLPFRLLYGSGSVSAPAYDFARLPPAATGFERAREGVLGTERANEAFEAPADTRSFFERHDGLVEVALVLAALAVAAAGVLALRRRT